MPRQPTNNYGYTTDTRFEWATSDNDKFDRELDLYRLAQALETHDHARNEDNSTARRGAPIGINALGSQSITNTMLAPGAVTTDKIANGTIRGEDIQDRTIADIKLANDKMNVAGGNFLGYIRVMHNSQNLGGVWMGTGNSYLSFDGSQFNLHNDTVNGRIRLVGDTIWSMRRSYPQTAYHYFGDTGNVGIYSDGTSFNLFANGGNGLLNNQRIWTDAYHPISDTDAFVEVPVGGIVMFHSTAEVTSAGPHWEVDPSCAGRLLVGAGSPGSGAFPGQPAGGFTANAGYGSTWMPMTGLTVDLSGLSAAANETTGAKVLVPIAGGNTEVSKSLHTHTVSGSVSNNAGTVAWIPPSWAAVFARRKL